jgi:3',5'-cyclic AMP phosphodiesterase CpdA
MAPARAGVFRLAHVSDPHLSTLEGVHWRALLNKRALGYVSWRVRRRREHRPEVLECLRQDLTGAAPDHVVITGDLTHVGTPAECREAGDWLRRLGPPDRISLVPGNHDCYAPAAWDETVGLWQPYMEGDPATGSADKFPYLRRRGPVAIIGLSTALPTAPFFATGRIGRGQLDRLAEILGALRGQGLFRVVILHHPPAAGVTGFRRRLTDAADFRAIIAAEGSELVLHGHAHRWVRSGFAAGARRIHVFGIPSASALTGQPSRRAGYCLFDIAAAGNGWEVVITERRLDAGGRSFETRAQEPLAVPAAPGG